ncbi:dienelactone hydrolase family protein [Guyparkeria hydrothermalis]|uniref:dienelactone hydrolase family protein n=1 Tax=Guyparkeria hydrothermalis TaxID=923 RepID=UPI00201FC2A8|nr:dienelactone hydrolase family protein [Guyparkeria hydrothermalis]MCL7750406.1 dienelactone hydrolase family protein [Guyparkeria hydrothermalis]
MAAEIKTEELEYRSGDLTMKGLVAFDANAAGPRPVVLVVPEFWGRTAYMEKRARDMAEAGYVGFAIDLYGDGRVTEDAGEATELMNQSLADFDALKTRYRLAIEAIKRHDAVDAERLGAIGYCFGGAVGLSMARQGVRHDAFATFHAGIEGLAPIAGSVDTPTWIFTGEEDPMADPQQVERVAEEMRAAGAEVHVTRYPGVSHAFTNPGADAKAEKFGLPLSYDPAADRDSLTKTLSFFADKLG